MPMEWNIYVVINAVWTVVTVILLYQMNSKINNLSSFNDMLRDKLARLNSGLDKLDAGLDWFLSREGVKVDYCHANWRWLIVSRDDSTSLYRAMKTIDREQREALAKALYEANLQAMRDFDKEQHKKEKGK